MTGLSPMTPNRNLFPSLIISQKMFHIDENEKIESYNN